MDILTSNDAALENIQTYFMQKRSKVFFGSWKIEGKLDIHKTKAFGILPKFSTSYWPQGDQLFFMNY